MLVISQNTYHIEICNDEDCHECAVIQISQIMICMLQGIVIIISIEVSLYSILYRIRKIYYQDVESSLIFKKVQLNE